MTVAILILFFISPCPSPPPSFPHPPLQSPVSDSGLVPLPRNLATTSFSCHASHHRPLQSLNHFAAVLIGKHDSRSTWPSSTLSLVDLRPIYIFIITIPSARLCPPCSWLTSSRALSLHLHSMPQTHIGRLREPRRGEFVVVINVVYFSVVYAFYRRDRRFAWISGSSLSAAISFACSPNTRWKRRQGLTRHWRNDGTPQNRVPNRTRGLYITIITISVDIILPNIILPNISDTYVVLRTVVRLWKTGEMRTMENSRYWRSTLEMSQETYMTMLVSKSSTKAGASIVALCSTWSLFCCYCCCCGLGTAPWKTAAAYAALQQK